MSLKLLLFFSRTSATAVLSEFRGYCAEGSLYRFKNSVLNGLSRDQDIQNAKLELAVDTDLQNFIMENAMTVEVPSGWASSLTLTGKSPLLINTLSCRLKRCLIVPNSFDCRSDIQQIRFVVRIVCPNQSNDCFEKLLKKITILERERSFIASGRLCDDLLLEELHQWPSVTASVNRIDTRPLLSFDNLYSFISVHEVCIDFPHHLPMSQMKSVMDRIVSAGLGTQVTLPPFSIYLRSVHFRPESLLFPD